MISTCARALALGMVCLATILLAPPAHAQERGAGTTALAAPRADGPQFQRVFGQIAGILGPAAGPTGLVIQQQQGKAVAAKTVTIRLDAARTVLRARTAEAQVEGLAVGDFAVVLATRSNGDLTARRVEFDVDPFGPIRFFTVTGTVLRLNRAGTQILLSLPGGTTRWIILTDNTRYTLDGVPTATVPVLQHNNVVTVDIHLVERGWVAQAVNLKSTHAAALVH